MEAKQCESDPGQTEDGSIQTTVSNANKESANEESSSEEIDGESTSGSQSSAMYTASSSKLWFSNILR